MYPTVKQHQTAVEALGQGPLKWLRGLETLRLVHPNSTQSLESIYLCFYSVVPSFSVIKTFLPASQVEYQVLILLRCLSPQSNVFYSLARASSDGLFYSLKRTHGVHLGRFHRGSLCPLRPKLKRSFLFLLLPAQKSYHRHTRAIR